MWQYKDLTGKEVVVHASGMTYAGRLVEMGETSLLLRAETGFREVPLNQVTRVEERGGGESSDDGFGGGSILSPSPLKQFDK